jgi:hypothetical protein
MYAEYGEGWLPGRGVVHRVRRGCLPGRDVHRVRRGLAYR